MTISFVTTTSYGSWLPGGFRGYVRKGVTLPGDTVLLKLSRNTLKSSVVSFSAEERQVLLNALTTACKEFGYQVSDVTIESTHMHGILFHGNDAIDVVAGRLKTRMRQSLHRGRIWTEGYCGEPLFDEAAIENARDYIARHPGCVMLNGQLISGGTPRQSRGLPSGG